MRSEGTSMGRPARWLVTIEVDRPASPPSPAARFAKRALDVGVASLVLLLALPLLVVLAVAIKVESRGPVLHRCWRAGLRSAPLGVVKFRKMYEGAAGPPLTVSNDVRLTRVGAVLARTHLDELPQLWNVLVGQMSLVGPRPEDRRFTRLHPTAYGEILAVRPGLTGWTQLVWTDEWRQLSSARDRVRFYVDEVLPRKVEMDRSYVHHGRFASDLKVLLWTPLVLVLGFTVAVDSARRELRLVRDSAPPQPVPVPEHDAVEEVVG